VKGWAAQTQRARLGSQVSEEQIGWWTDFMGAADPEVCIAVSGMAGGLDLTGLLPGIKVPTLVVTTADSALASVETVRSWQQAIPGSELLVLPGDSYHIAAASPDECAARVLDFIQRHRIGGPPARAL
jgi:3-oxoadipate enol-lactonase